MKWQARTAKKEYPVVALFTRAWIEIHKKMRERKLLRVALFTRAWIEIVYKADPSNDHPVALFTRAWIEIRLKHRTLDCLKSPSSRGRGLK